MFRAIFTLLSYVTLAGGLVAAVIDGTHSLGAGRLMLSSVGEVALPRFPNLPIWLYKLHPWLWEPVGEQLMRFPLCLFLGGVGVLCFMLKGRHSSSGGFA